MPWHKFHNVRHALYILCSISDKHCGFNRCNQTYSVYTRTRSYCLNPLSLHGHTFQYAFPTPRIIRFYPNVTRLRSGLAMAIANPSVVCNARASYTEGVKTVGNIFSLFCTLAILCAKFYGDRPRGTLPSMALNTQEW